MSQQLPATHKAIQLRNPGPNPTVSLTADLPLPTVSPGDVLIRSTYAGINFIENYFISGLYPAPTDPYTLGSEGSGYIVALGTDVASHPDASIRELKLGDRVAHVTRGAYAQYTAVPAEKVFKLPDDLSDDIGAATLLQGLTAIVLTREAYPAQRGDLVLVHAAAGGVGTILVQLLSHVIGARVIATASTKEKRDIAKANGAEWVIPSGKGDEDRDQWIAAVKSIPEVSARGGVTAIYDSVGKSTFDGGLEVLARKGTFVSFGNASGAVEPFSILRLAPKCLRLIRASLDPYTSDRKDFVKYAEELVGHLTKGNVKASIYKTYPWEQINQALEVRFRLTPPLALLQWNY